MLQTGGLGGPGVGGGVSMIGAGWFDYVQELETTHET
jgi:hypothetical protein